MPINFYEGKGESELLEIRQQLLDARNGGSQTSVGIAPGIRHDFAAVPPAELNRRLQEVLYALYVLNPDVYSDPYTQKTMKVVTQYL